MKLWYPIFFHLSFCLSLCNNLFSDQQAVVCKPIIDLIGQPAATLYPDTPAVKAYESLPCCATQINSATTCPRLHQLLYNDIVEITKTSDNEACITIPQAYYITAASSTPQNQYWTLKENLKLIDDMQKQYADHLPQPIEFSRKDMHQPNIITLTDPHYDSKLKTTFSVGTRFLKTPKPHKKIATAYEVFAFDFPKNKEHTIKIPCNKCILSDNQSTQEEQIAQMITILKKWCHTKKGCIPYVWGGTSFTQPVHGAFKEITKTGNCGDYSYYDYEKNTSSPRNGFDCSGVILRAAQIVGIPYFFKNTTTIGQCLKPLQPSDTIALGDIILIKGHVMIVSDVAKNLLIEARGYSHGYGKLHEIKISEVFDGVETYKDLADIYFDKKIIKRKDKDSKIRDTFKNIQLFSMRSAQ